MSTENYVAKEFLGPLASGWQDGATLRPVHVCANVVLAEEASMIADGDVVIVYARNGEGERVADLHGETLISEGYDILTATQDNPVLARFIDEFDRLVAVQPTERRLRVAGAPSTEYNEDLRANAAQWSVTVRV